MHGVDKPARTVGAEDDNVDQLGFETPRSGVATPQPDLHDKRLPGIMSYFGQVGEDSSASQMHPSIMPHPESVEPLGECLEDKQLQDQIQHTSSATLSSHHHPAESSLPCTLTQPNMKQNHHPHHLPSQDMSNCPTVTQTEKLQASHSYPTPPTSQTSSSAGSPIPDLSSSSEKKGTFASEASLRCPTNSKISGTSQVSIASTPLSVPSQPAGASTAQGACPLTAQESLQTSSQSLPVTSGSARPAAPSRWFSLEGLVELTRGAIFKSGPPTPTRALSTAHPNVDGRETPGRSSNDGAETSGTQTPRSSGAQAPVPKGKLSIKITEARGLRKSRDPYVVAVFQRSELISSGPRPSEEDEHLSSTPIAMGGIAIQRQSSDSGRPPMAIPMRSRQSSNTSITDYSTFRNRTSKAIYSNPKWDAQAIL